MGFYNLSMGYLAQKIRRIRALWQEKAKLALRLLLFVGKAQILRENPRIASLPYAWNLGILEWNLKRFCNLFANICLCAA